MVPSSKAYKQLSVGEGGGPGAVVKAGKIGGSGFQPHSGL